MNKKSFTTHQVNKFCDVYPTTVIKWIKEGILPAFTTPGGTGASNGKIYYEEMVR